MCYIAGEEVTCDNISDSHACVGQYFTYETLHEKVVIFYIIGRPEGESIVLCISPLNSLMIDQQRSFGARGIHVEFVGEAQNDKDTVKRVVEGSVPLVLISPENITSNPLFRGMLLKKAYKEKLVTFVIDEAHCIKAWYVTHLTFHEFISLFAYRGDKFRVAFSRLGEIRSSLASDVPVLAVTATATRSTFDCIVNKLAMENVFISGLSPNRDNVFLSVIANVSLPKFASSIAEALKLQGISYPKSLIFCRSYNDCNAVYDHLETALGPYITHPRGYPNIRKYRVIELYTRGSTNKAKEIILEEFVKVDTNIRVIVATSAFGMGIDCPNIINVYHWEPPHTIEEYVQESGRAGRNSQQCYATLIYNSPRGHISSEMELYGKNTTTCRRLLLYKDFLFHTHTTVSPLCKCCDICVSICECDDCKSV